MAARTKVDWVVVGDGDCPGLCLRCGKKLHLPLPQPLTVWVAAARAFVKIHSRCVEKAA
jgi:hypothetical protein